MIERPTPRNRPKFPCDRSSPLVCTPARRVEFSKPPPEPIALALERLTSPETLRYRSRKLPELARRRRRVPGFGMQPFTSDPDRLPRFDFRAAQLRFLAACVERCSASSGIVGQYVEVEIAGQVKRPRYRRALSRHQLAAFAGVSLGQVDEVLSSLKAVVTWIGRRQRRQKIVDHRGQVRGYTGDVATLKLRDDFWQALGDDVWKALQRHRARLELEKGPRHPLEQPEASRLKPNGQEADRSLSDAEARRRRLASWPPPDDPPPNR